MDKLYKEAIQRLAEEYISKVKCCDECFAESFCIEQQRREGRLPCKDKTKCVSNIYDYLHSIYCTKADFYMEKYICSEIVQHEIYKYCDSRQSKRNPCKRCKFRIPKKFNSIDCIFTKRVKDWDRTFDNSVVRTNRTDS